VRAATTKYNDREYRKHAAALKQDAINNNKPCHLCGEHFDFTLPYTHPLAFTADHLDAIANGGDLLGNLAPAHRKCNSSRGKKRLKTQVHPPSTSRRW